MDTLIEQLLKWEYVGEDREYEKYFRYACFSLKWRKITEQPEKVAYYIDSFVEASQRGQDVAVSLCHLLRTADKPLLKELLAVVRVITEGDLNGLTKKEIAAAKNKAQSIWEESVIEESLYDHFSDQ